MAGMDWFRWHHGSVTDPKFQLVARRAGASLSDVIAVWAYVLEAASQAEVRGNFGALDTEAIDCHFGFAEGLTDTILRCMHQRDLIDEDLALVCSWDKRQPKREREDDTAADRKRAQRERDAAKNGVTPGVTPRHAMSRQETPRVEESREEEKKPPPPPPGGSGGGESALPTKAGEVCRAIRTKGVPGVNPSNPELLALIGKGVPLETFEAAAQVCIDANPPKGMAYLLGIVKRQLGEAAAIASGVGMPTKPWDESKSSILAKAAELGIPPWNESDLSANRETFPAYTARVRRAVEAMEPA